MIDARVLYMTCFPANSSESSCASPLAGWQPTVANAWAAALGTRDKGSAAHLMPKCFTTSSSCPCASSVLRRKSAPSPGRAAKRWSRVTNMRPSAVACAMQAGTCLRCVSGLMCSESTPRDLKMSKGGFNDLLCRCELRHCRGPTACQPSQGRQAGRARPLAWQH